MIMMSDLFHFFQGLWLNQQSPLKCGPSHFYQPMALQILILRVLFATVLHAAGSIPGACELYTAIEDFAA
jgi:hypothetical protein